VALDTAQSPIITERAVTATYPVGWEGSYYPNYYEFGYTSSPEATRPDSDLVNVLAVSPDSTPVQSPVRIVLDIAERDPEATLYLMIRANLQSGLSSNWSKPTLINDPSMYIPPVPTPSPTPTPTPTPNPTPSPTPTPAPRNCPKLQFVGVRGSGETKKDAGGYGATVASVKDVIEKMVSGTQSFPVDYPAIPIAAGGRVYLEEYVKSVARGQEALDAFLTQFIVECPHTYVILAGYSQGAQVAGDEFAYLTSYEKSHIAALVLIGDPRFNPNQPEVNEGNYNKNLSGIYQIVVPDSERVIEEPWVSNVKSYCSKHDPVCNYSVKNTLKCKVSGNKCAHLQYVNEAWTKLAAHWAIKHWRNLPPLP
jgi:hypothetical protein